MISRYFYVHVDTNYIYIDIDICVYIYCRTHNVSVCLYIAYIAFGSASLYIKTYFLLTVSGGYRR